MRALTPLALSVVLISLLCSQAAVSDAQLDERVALTMTAENEMNLYVHGVYTGKLGLALRSALDGDAAPLMDLGGVKGLANRSVYSTELKKICSAVACGDGTISKGDVDALGKLAEVSDTIYDLFALSGVSNATATLNGAEPRSITVIQFGLSSIEGSVNAVLPVYSDYILTLKYQSAPSPITVSFRFGGKQGERKVAFSFTSIQGWDASVKDGILSQSTRTDYPSSGYVTVEGVLASPNQPASVGTSPKQADVVCWSVLGLVILLSLAGMYLAWRRMKKQRAKEEKIMAGKVKKEAGKEDGPATERGRTMDRLKDLRERGIITDEEYSQKLKETDAKY